MNLTLLSGYATLFATDLESFFRGLGNEFNGKKSKLGSSDISTIVIVLLVISIIVYFLSRYAAKDGSTRLINSPNKLFHELCVAHKLDRRGRQALRLLAKFHRLTHPALVFVEPERFYGVMSLPSLQAHAPRLLELRELLFSEPTAPT